MTLIPSMPTLRVKIIFTWSLSLIALMIYLVVWFCLSLFFMPLIDIIISTALIVSPWDSIITLLRNVFTWSPIFAVATWICWSALNSSRRDIQTWEG